jgi:hypothetical protein
MKCPRCDADISTQKKCSKCGFIIADDPDGLEVEYKDFKTSELLEIRQKKQTTSQGAETIIFREQPEEDGIKKQTPANPSLEAKKRSSPILAVVLLILALIICGLFLVRFLVLN